MNLQKHLLTAALDAALSSAIDRMTLKHIDLQVSYPEKDCFVLIDFEKIQLAFLNIIINAVEAMEAEQGKLKNNNKKFQ